MKEHLIQCLGASTPFHNCMASWYEKIKNQKHLFKKKFIDVRSIPECQQNNYNFLIIYAITVVLKIQ